MILLDLFDCSREGWRVSHFGHGEYSVAVFVEVQSLIEVLLLKV